MSFGIRIVTTWNNLPENIAKAPSMNAFENWLDKCWEYQENLYDYKPSLRTLVRKERKLFESTKESEQSMDVQARAQQQQ